MVGCCAREDVVALKGLLLRIDRGLEDDARIDQIRALEELKCAAEAAQAELAVDLDESVRAKDAARGTPTQRQGKGVAAQVALARRVSLHRGQIVLGLGKVVRAEMPCTRAAWRDGVIDEYRTTQLVRNTACLSREDRVAVDAEVAGDPDALEQLSPRAGGRAGVRGGVPGGSDVVRGTTPPGRGRPAHQPAAGTGRDDLVHRAAAGQAGGRGPRRVVGRGRPPPGRR